MLDILIAFGPTLVLIAFVVFMTLRQKGKIIGAAEKVHKACARCKFESVELTVDKIAEVSELSKEEIKTEVVEISDSFDLPPNREDPFGCMEKLKHLLDTREIDIRDDIKALCNGNENGDYLESLVGFTSVFFQGTRILKHLIERAKKGDMFSLYQLQIGLGMFQEIFGAYERGYIDFYHKRMIGDGIGPLTVAHFVDKAGGAWKPTEVFPDTSTAEFEYDGRSIVAIKAKGPHSNVGKPGRLLASLLRRDDIVIMVDAAIRTEGEETGHVRRGRGAVIGGAGYERFVIETTCTKLKVPHYGAISGMTMLQGVTAMPKAIWKSLPKLISHIKRYIEKKSEPGQRVFVVGVGNTCGVPG